MSLAADFCASRVSFGLAALVCASALWACGLDAGGVLAGQSSASAASATSSGVSTSAGTGGGDSSSSSGAGGGAGGMSGAGGGGGGMPSECGDGILTPPEMCDDNNNSDEDACTADCSCGANNPDVIAFAGPGDGHCYMLFKTSKIWPDISDACGDVGAYTAAITTDKERSHVGGHLSQDVWIGGTDFQWFAEQEWEWENGEPWLIYPCDDGEPGCDNKIIFWNPKEPNGEGKEDCLELKADTDRFNDNWCFYTLPFLCEKSP
jgi:cysteine-rich repeat protein